MLYSIQGRYIILNFVPKHDVRKGLTINFRPSLYWKQHNKFLEPTMYADIQKGVTEYKLHPYFRATTINEIEILQDKKDK